jgi:hypothetical protein
MDANSLKKILNFQTNLKSLSLFACYQSELHQITQEDVTALKENGKKLEKFCYSSCVSAISKKNLEEEFKEQFKTIEVLRDAFLWTMKKDR